MANIDHKPSKYMLNLLHVLKAYADKDEKVVNAIVEISARSMNKYEVITESGQLKLDRVGYSTLVQPNTYGGIPSTYDEDNDPLDICIVNVTEALVPGSLVEARVIGIMKFEDGGERDDKVIAVINDDKRVDHIKSIDDLGEYYKTELQYFWEHYKDLKKPGTCKVLGFYGVNEAIEIIDECVERYNKDYLPKFDEEEGCCGGGCCHNN